MNLTKRHFVCSVASLTFHLLAAGCSPSTAMTTTAPVVATRHILFVGNSFTHGAYLPVRTYNGTPTTGGLGSVAASALVVDENFHTTVSARAESSAEYGPWGGIPGIFSELASEASLPYDVHIDAISGAPLATVYAASRSVIVQPVWNTVVLQGATFEPIPPPLSGNSSSSPAAFCTSVTTIEQAIHAAAPSANVFLYETGVPADTAYKDSATTAFSDAAYLTTLGKLSDAYHDAYLTAAAQDGHIAGVAATGDAWSRAWSEGVANPDPYGGAAPGVSLTFNYQPGSQPSTTNRPTDSGFHHPGIYGAYLNGLVLFQKITGSDVRTFGAAEKAASALGIPAPVAVKLQLVAWESVTQQNTQLVHPAINACSLTQ